MKKIGLFLLLMSLSGCWQDYLEHPYYHNNSETAYPFRVKNNAFTGIPAAVGDLAGCAFELPLYPAYHVMEKKYKNDQDATQALKSTYAFIPRSAGHFVSAPFRLVKWAFYDVWVYPGN